MKKLLALLLTILIILSLFSCDNNPVGTVEKPSGLRLYHFVGVWTDPSATRYYRFTSNGTWFYYNDAGEVVNRGTVTFDGESFFLKPTRGETILLRAEDQDGISDQNGIVYSRTENPSLLVSSEKYRFYFNDWYEEGNLSGNVLSIKEPAEWEYRDPTGELISSGEFCAYAGEEEILYLYEKKSGIFFTRLRYSDDCVICERILDDVPYSTLFCSKENSKERKIYFSEKSISCNYRIGSGMRLLRNGGAAYNEDHDYKKMPVYCKINIIEDQLTATGERSVKVAVTYHFMRSDLPILSGGKFFNSVRFSQYDYYSGELLHMTDSNGNENVSCKWNVKSDDREVSILCDFSSDWSYSGSGEVLAEWVGTYQLTMPKDYDGFVICLRPVFNSYSSQVSASISPSEGTLLLEDLGEDVSKSVFCRIPMYIDQESTAAELCSSSLLSELTLDN